MKTTVVYDLDDTLISQRQFAFSGFKAVGKWLEENEGVENFETTAKSIYNQGSRGKIFDEVFDALVLKPNFERVQKCVEVYRSHTPTINFFEDAIEQITQAQGKHLQAVITDGLKSVQKNKIKCLNLEKHLDLVLCSDEWGDQAWKPASVCFEKVMEAFKGQSDEFIYIGDNPLKDFTAPKALGWKTVRIRRACGDYFNITGGEQADIEIETFWELPNAFGGCCRKIPTRC